MNGVKWIKILTTMFDDEKIKIIESMPDRDAILVIWIKLLGQAGKSNMNGYLLLSESIPYTDEMLSTIFNRPLNTVRLALETFTRFGMIDFDGSKFHVSNWDKHQNIEGLDKIREQTNARVTRYREKQKVLKENVRNVTETLHETQSNETELELDKEYKPLSDTHKIEYTKAEQLFEILWMMYPKKEGKGRVSKSKKTEIFKIGIEEMTRAVERYKKAKRGKEKEYLQMGSTFFNTGYVDYLDKEFVNNKPVERDIYKPI